ncbi:MAG: cytochrome oxidase subunit III [Cyclobacteriaceae bacterium]|nr:MAG: cytochrome oxidase subunit III [Cyclobacteriaceae bacterium]
MGTNIRLVENPSRPLSVHPHKFALWLFIVSIVMIFASLTSAFIVKQGDGSWLDYNLPSMFWYTTAAIILSSALLQWGYFAARANQLKRLTVLVAITTLLGMVFLVGQWLAWGQLVDMEVYFVGNPAGSFVYVLSGLHAFHLLSGIIFLIVVFVSSLKHKIHSGNLVRMEMCVTYWHFLGALWVYLFVFLIFYH